MSNPMIKIVNVQTGEEIEREMTADEMEKQSESNAIQSEIDAELESINAPKAAQRRAILDHLKITEEEARILLGGN
jgi:hypothetical protein